MSGDKVFVLCYSIMEKNVSKTDKNVRVKIDFQKLSDYYIFEIKKKYFSILKNLKQKKWVIWVAVYLDA